MGCSKRVILKNRELVADLFVRGNMDAASSHRFTACCRASKCNFLCKWLVKGLGLRAFCTAGTGETERPELRKLLRDPEFKCPEGNF